MQERSAGTPPTGDATVEFVPADLELAATLCYEALAPLADADWECLANGLEWTCRRTLQHISNALDWYTLLLVDPTPERLRSFGLRYVEQSIQEMLAIVQRRAKLLALLAAGSEPTARGFHSWGYPDPSGYVAMGCAEILLHTDDIAQAFGETFQAPGDISWRVVRRLFPWAPLEGDGWQVLNWAAGRLSLPERGRVPANWVWHASPVPEWDGEIKTRESYAAPSR
jgi:hypothetical protein